MCTPRNVSALLQAVADESQLERCTGQMRFTVKSWDNGSRRLEVVARRRIERAAIALERRRIFLGAWTTPYDVGEISRRLW